MQDYRSLFKFQSSGRYDMPHFRSPKLSGWDWVAIAHLIQSHLNLHVLALHGSAHLSPPPKMIKASLTCFSDRSEPSTLHDGCYLHEDVPTTICLSYIYIYERSACIRIYSTVYMCIYSHTHMYVHSYLYLPVVYEIKRKH